MRLIQSVALLACLTVLVIFVSATAKAPTDPQKSLSLDTIITIGLALLAALVGTVGTVIGVCIKATRRLTRLEAKTDTNEAVLNELRPVVTNLENARGGWDLQIKDNKTGLHELRSVISSLENAQKILMFQMEHHEKALKTLESTLLDNEIDLRKKGLLSSGQEQARQEEQQRCTTQIHIALLTELRERIFAEMRQAIIALTSLQKEPSSSSPGDGLLKSGKQKRNDLQERRKPKKT